MKDVVVDYFKDIFNEPRCLDAKARREMLDMIPKKVAKDLNRALEVPFSMEEVKSVVFNMKKEKAPGLDGFPLGFL